MKQGIKVWALLVASLLVLPAGRGDTLYKWVDAQGNVHYSDKPHPGATRLHLPKPTTYSAPTAMPPNARVASDAHPAPAQQAYTGFEIASPTADQVFWNVRSVTVTLSVQPMLHPGDEVTITLDDKTIGPRASTSATFDNLDRGEHTVHATLSSPGGNIIAKPVTFYIQKSTQHLH